MNLKPVELQMAIPRATEVGKVQQQTQQKPQQDQALLQQMTAKQAEQAPQKTHQVDESNGEKVREEEKKQQRDGKRKKKPPMKMYNKSVDDKDKEPEHPFKGKRIDLSL